MPGCKCPECNEEFQTPQALGSHITYQHRRKDEEFEKAVKKVRDFLDDNPGSLEYLKRILSMEDEESQRGRELGLTMFLGWDARAIPIPKNELEPMLYGEIIQLQYTSAKYTNYALVDREATRKAVDDFESEAQAMQAGGEISLPDDFLDIVQEHEDLKEVIIASLTSDSPIHVLMVGEPATAKSLVLLEIKRALPQFCRYILGGTTSKAGLVDFLIAHKPRILIVDELDKMSLDDQTALLSLMEDGIVTRMKHGKRETVNLTTWVFAGANTTKPFTDGLLSRFYIEQLDPYTPETFRRVARAVLVQREEVPEDIAEYIANETSKFSRDVRNPRKIARLAKSANYDRRKIDVFIRGMSKGLKAT